MNVTPIAAEDVRAGMTLESWGFTYLVDSAATHARRVSIYLKVPDARDTILVQVAKGVSLRRVQSSNGAAS